MKNVLDVRQVVVQQFILSCSLLFVFFKSGQNECSPQTGWILDCDLYITNTHFILKLHQYWSYCAFCFRWMLHDLVARNKEELRHSNLYYSYESKTILSTLPGSWQNSKWEWETPAINCMWWPAPHPCILMLVAMILAAGVYGQLF